MLAVFEGTQNYRSVLYTRAGKLRVEHHHPWFSNYGIYKHFYTEIEGSTIRFIPCFVFGVPKSVLHWLYSGEDGVPVDSFGRVLVQCFMNLVIISVVFLLWVHNKINVNEIKRILN